MILGENGRSFITVRQETQTQKVIKLFLERQIILVD